MGYDPSSLGTPQDATQVAIAASVLPVNGSFGMEGNATLAAALPLQAPAAELTDMWGLQAAVLLSCIVARGVLAGSVLKQLDAIAKGLIDVTAIVLCTAIQIIVEGTSLDGTEIGIQVLMLLSIVGFIIARSSTPQGSQALKSHDRPVALELRDTVRPVSRHSPKVL
mmetsp:Transcript_88747/g.275665  ORF Transcript_88747/g.275665 Transcript_88747/m.275665 type:complete len:167 (-) Transcript_88747:47-547(-)